MAHATDLLQASLKKILLGCQKKFGKHLRYVDSRAHNEVYCCTCGLRTEGELHYCFSASLALRCRSLRVDKLAYKERSNGQVVLRSSVRLFIRPSVYL